MVKGMPTNQYMCFWRHSKWAVTVWGICYSIAGFLYYQDREDTKRSEKNFDFNRTQININTGHLAHLDEKISSNNNMLIEILNILKKQTRLSSNFTTHLFSSAPPDSQPDR